LLGVSYLVTHGIFLPVRALKVSQVRASGGEKQKPRRRAGCDRAFGFQSLFSRSVKTLTRLQPNPAQQAPTTLRGDSE
jgi:hypothetical protein